MLEPEQVKQQRQRAREALDELLFRINGCRHETCRPCRDIAEAYNTLRDFINEE